MESINEQLQIGTPKNPNIPSRYARGLLSIQPQLGTEDWALDQYNDTQSLGNYSNMVDDEYSYGNGYGLFCGRRCGDAKREACIPFKRGAMKGQKPPECIEAEKKAVEQARAATSSGGKGKGKGKGMSAGAKVGIGIGVLAVVGVLVYLIARKR